MPFMYDPGTAYSFLGLPWWKDPLAGLGLQDLSKFPAIDDNMLNYGQYNRPETATSPLQKFVPQKPLGPPSLYDMGIENSPFSAPLYPMQPAAATAPALQPMAPFGVPPAAPLPAVGSPQPPQSGLFTKFVDTMGVPGTLMSGAGLASGLYKGAKAAFPFAKQAAGYAARVPGLGRYMLSGPGAFLMGMGNGRDFTTSANAGEPQYYIRDAAGNIVPNPNATLSLGPQQGATAGISPATTFADRFGGIKPPQPAGSLVPTPVPTTTFPTPQKLPAFMEPGAGLTMPQNPAASAFPLGVKPQTAAATPKTPVIAPTPMGGMISPFSGPGFGAGENGLMSPANMGMGSMLPGMGMGGLFNQMAGMNNMGLFGKILGFF